MAKTPMLLVQTLLISHYNAGAKPGAAGLNPAGAGTNPAADSTKFLRNDNVNG